MRVLYIGWCGISFIERGAFDSLTRLTELSLDGNLLGPRKLLLYSEGVQPGLHLRQLNLVNIGINSAETYSLYSVLVNFPNLDGLFIGSNLLKALPTFLKANNETNQNSTSIEVLEMNKNFISNFSQVAGKELCSSMPLLSTLKIESNQLVDVSGMCTTIRVLSLANNKIGKNQDINFRRLSQLTDLNHLDLLNNQIDFIPQYLFTKMPKLGVLILGQNNIKSFSLNLALYNPKLAILDLSANVLHSITDSSLRNLTNLRYLYLQSNSLRTISSKLIQSLPINLPHIKGIAIAGNPFLCSCTNLFKNWVLDSKILMQTDSITCTLPEVKKKWVTVRVVDYIPDKFFCFIRTPLMIAGTSLAGFLVSLAIALPCYKYRWYISHCRIAFRAIVEKLQEVRFEQQCEYDALVFYNSDSESDREWVEQKLIPFVEEAEQSTENQVIKKPKLFLADRDCRLGASIYNELCETVKNSRKIIILLTNSYLSSTSCLHQAQFLTGTNMLDNSECYQPDRILVIILEELNEDIIVTPITSLLTSNANVINISEYQNNERRMRRVWKKVRNFVSKPKYVYRKRKDKTKSTQPITEPVTADESGETTPLLA